MADFSQLVKALQIPIKGASSASILCLLVDQGLPFFGQPLSIAWYFFLSIKTSKNNRVNARYCGICSEERRRVLTTNATYNVLRLINCTLRRKKETKKGKVNTYTL